MIFLLLEHRMQFWIAILINFFFLSHNFIIIKNGKINLKFLIAKKIKLLTQNFFDPVLVFKVLTFTIFRKLFLNCFFIIHIYLRKGAEGWKGVNLIIHISSEQIWNFLLLFYLAGRVCWLSKNVAVITSDGKKSWYLRLLDFDFNSRDNSGNFQLLYQSLLLELDVKIVHNPEKCSNNSNFFLYLDRHLPPSITFKNLLFFWSKNFFA